RIVAERGDVGGIDAEPRQVHCRIERIAAEAAREQAVAGGRELDHAFADGGDFHAVAHAAQKGSWTFIDCERSLASSNALTALSNGSEAEISGLTSRSPSPIRRSASSNSRSKRKVPRNCSSFATMVLIGKVISPPSPSCTITPPGRITSNAVRNAAWFPD